MLFSSSLGGCQLLYMSGIALFRAVYVFHINTFCVLNAFSLFSTFSIMVLLGLLVQVLCSSLQVVYSAGYLVENQTNSLLLMFHSQASPFPNLYRTL
jgi:hypothetical protein